MPKTTDSQPERLYTRESSLWGKESSNLHIEGGWFSLRNQTGEGERAMCMRLKEYIYLFGKRCEKHYTATVLQLLLTHHDGLLPICHLTVAAS